MPRWYWALTVSVSTREAVMGARDFRTFTFSSWMLSGSRSTGRLHRHQAEKLQHVVLHHVAQGARALVVAAPGADTDRFRHGDLDVIHVAIVPDGLEDAVAEPHQHDVLHRLLAQVMVDPVDLALGKGTGDASRSARGRFRDPCRAAFLL